MPDRSALLAEIAAEQRHIDRVYQRVAELRLEAERLRDKGLELGHGAAREAIFEQATMLFERDAAVLHASRLLRVLDTEHEGLVFGRLDTENGERAEGPLYVGRLGIRDESFDNLVTDWRAPAAAAFYRATAKNPMGVLRRRVIRSFGQQVVDIDDDVLAVGPLPPGITVVGEGALMAALGRARGDAMRDIVATIQAEQDEVIRAPADRVTELVGGPGTGKTVVALHRVAYLLYDDPRRMAGGVLVVGPSHAFMSYIARVLPSIGEDSAELRAVGELFDGVTATRLDPPPVAAIKGSPRMVGVLRRLVRQVPPDTPDELRAFYRGEVLRIGREELAKTRRTVHARGGQTNRIRVRAAEALLEALWRQAARRADDRFRPNREELITEIGERIEFHRFLVTWWPNVTPAEVLGWLADRERLAVAAHGRLSADEVDLLAGSFAEPGFSVADVALLDELRVLLGRPRRRRSTLAMHTEPEPQHYDGYSHIVLDEAQDLSPMQWRMIGRRGPAATWTVVGDPVQSSWPDPDEAAEAKDRVLGPAARRRVFTLRTNYRNSTEIFALATEALGGLVADGDLPVAVRSTGIQPTVTTTTDLPAAVAAAAATLLD
ncbi:MAG TPA: ATP-dependent DNA helicase, partial [Pseudonocardiaceae bacterium]|nr:ATP-dependent DNA helicase [Pseudonocardiaceae bacterium]